MPRCLLEAYFHAKAQSSQTKYLFLRSLRLCVNLFYSERSELQFFQSARNFTF